MPCVCRDCGEKHDFSAEDAGSCSYTRTVYLDEDGDVVDSEDFDYDELNSNGFYNLECGNCGSGNIAELSLEEWDEWIEGESEDNQVPQGIESRARPNNSRIISSVKPEHKEETRKLLEEFNAKDTTITRKGEIRRKILSFRGN